MVRNLALDLLPSNHTNATRENTAWLESTQTHAPGFGSQMRMLPGENRYLYTYEHELNRAGTDDPNIRERFRKANEVVKGMANTVFERQCLRDAYQASLGQFGQIHRSRYNSLDLHKLTLPKSTTEVKAEKERIYEASNRRY